MSCYVMTDEVFERMRAAVARTQAEHEAEGHCLGRRWACEGTDYRAMRNLEAQGPDRDSDEWEQFFADDHAAHELYFTLYPEDDGDCDTADEFWLGVADAPIPSPEFVRGFAEGVLDVLGEFQHRQRAEHKQVHVVWNGRTEEVDEEMGPLILALLKAHVVVDSCGQEILPGVAWLEILSVPMAKKFLWLVGVAPDAEDLDVVNGSIHVEGVPLQDTLYGRVHGYAREDNWEFVIETDPDDEEVELGLEVWFPRTDLPLLVDLIQRQVEAKEDGDV
jgi:hypothetical protein